MDKPIENPNSTNKPLTRMIGKVDINPIFVKELRSLMRGNRAFITLTGVLIMLGAFSYGLYKLVLAALRYSNTPLSPQVGQVLFAGIALLELVMVCAITPAVTSGAISGEKEKLTYEMLLTTPLNPARILSGKLLSALSYVFIMIFAAVPMGSLVSIFGGVSLRDMVKSLIVLASVAVVTGAIGLFVSVVMGKTGRATAITYLIVLALLLGPIFASGATGVLKQNTPPRWMLIPSPISALSSAFSPSVNIQSVTNIFWMLGSVYWIAGTNTVSQTSIPRPLYHYSLVFYGFITLILYILSTRLIKPTRRWKIQWAEALVGLTYSLGFSAIILVAFLITSNRYENIKIIDPTPSVVESSEIFTPPSTVIPDNKVPPPPPTGSPVEASVEILNFEGGEAVIRSGPGVDYEVLGTVEPGGVIPALGITPDGQWIQLFLPESGPGTVWIWYEYVEIIGSLPTIDFLPTPIPSPTGTPAGMIYHVNIYL